MSTHVVIIGFNAREEECEWRQFLVFRKVRITKVVVSLGLWDEIRTILLFVLFSFFAIKTMVGVFLFAMFTGAAVPYNVYAAETDSASSNSDLFSVHGVLVSDGGSPYTEIRVVNDSEREARFILPWENGTIADVVVPGKSMRYVRVELPREKNSVRHNEKWMYYLVWESGEGKEQKVENGEVLLAAGWGLNINNELMFDNCSKVSWFYNDNGSPKRAKAMRRDVAKAFALLDKETGLRFMETNNVEESDIVVEWVRVGEEKEKGFGVDTVATAGVDGLSGKTYIRLAAGAERLGDKYSGVDPVVWTKERQGDRKSDARDSIVSWVRMGRVWVLVHEVMHVLGFEHSQREKSVMGSLDFLVGVMGEKAKRKERMGRLVVSDFDWADRNGLGTVYPKNECRVGKDK